MFDVTAFPLDPATSTLGFSGSRSFNPVDHPNIALDLKRLPPFEAYITGACVGFDHYAGLVMATLHPDATHVVVIPGRRGLIKDWWRSARVHTLIGVDMPAGSS